MKRLVPAQPDSVPRTSRDHTTCHVRARVYPSVGVGRYGVSRGPRYKGCVCATLQQSLNPAPPPRSS
eukprot:2552258-Rhodomonas_salina.2